MTITDERRLVTVLFADLVGFTGRAEQADPEAVRELQRAYFAAVAGEVERYGGTVEKFIGDAVMALFGAPVAHDDDAERALRTAFRIREAVARVDDQLEVRIGINTGEVVGGTAGPQAGDYSVSGDAVNVAARLQQSAQPSEILVGGTTRSLAAEAFAFAPLSEMTVKGRTEPIDAWRLERELPDRPRMRGGEARLVGRERELATIDAALEDVAAGRGMMLALVGEPGIGKSRLALEARQRAESEGFATAWTTSRSYASAFPYHLVAQLVPQLLDSHGEDPPPTLDALRAAVPATDLETLDRWALALDDVLGNADADDPRLADLSPAGRQRMLVHALGALLRARAAQRPMLVVLDDLQWADPASLAVVEELLDVVPQLRMAVAATYRTGWSHGWEGRSAYQQLNLRALRDEDARDLAAELLAGGSVTDDLARQVLERSAGNPLFLEQLLRGAQAARADGGGSAPHRLPETIHEMLLARLDALPPEARRMLQLASVVGMEFSARIVTALAAGDGADGADPDGADPDGALRILQRAELVVPRPTGGDQERLGFHHPLIHEVAYRSLLVRARRELHGRIGRWLEEHGGDELLSELARHYRDSDDVERARHYLPLAGERAEALNANREARDLYADAAALFDDDPERQAVITAAVSRQHYLLGEIREAIPIQETAVKLYENASAEVAALNARSWLGRLYWLNGDPAEADRQVGLAIEGLERLPPTPELAYAYANRSQSRMLRPDVDEGARLARKAIAIAEATGAILAKVNAENNLGTCLIWNGDPAGIEHLRISLDLARRHHLTDDVGRAYANASGQGNRIFPYPYAESEAFLREAIEFAQRTIPDGVFDQWIRSGYAEFLMSTARWPEAERVHEGMNAERAGAYLGSDHRAQRSHLLTYRGQADEGLELAISAAELSRRIGDLQAVLPAHAALAAARAGVGDDDEAIAALRRGVERRGADRELVLTSWFLFEGTDTLAVIAARDTASPALPAGLELLAGFARTVAPDAATGGALAQTATRQAMLGAAVEALAALGRAVGLGLELPSVGGSGDPFPGRLDGARLLDGEHRLFDGARIRLWLAEEAGDADLLGDAAAVFEELGAHPYLLRAQHIGA
ncbi:MAG TPA: BREX system ATP-binding domain-containing protein [Candidatus Limnocylindria bacterium]|nr:BREX system ATP-binding domain-containing protein [Candidatus Limnocylindria bacterium]